MVRKISILVSTLLASSVSLANENPQGFSGDLGLFALYSEGKSNLSTDSDALITSLDNNGDSISTGAVFPLGNIRYQSDRHLFFAGQSEDTFVKGILALELGYGYQLSPGSLLSLAVSPTIIKGKVWQNPYLTGTKRVETDIEGNAYRLKFENEFLTTNLAYYDRDIESEGSQHATLNRDGKGYFAEIALVLPFSSHLFIEPSLYYQKDDATGAAMAFDKLGAGVSATLLQNEYTFIFNGRYAKSDFNAVNPVFNSTRKDDHLSLTASLIEEGIFNVPPLSLIAQVSYSETDSNIAFYSEEDVSFLLGSLYEF
ncbi:DUF2860 family protein [Vibrio sp. 10N.261.55.A7]|uniref:DUF2860 family protein n=1 Tax=Vibrio sp. 10N.261.55.A7 TaxID=1880851 RepID=UPI000C8345E9|nr:DUF2860 family protein [Vibrio sp. 10N.261.55.A7]